MGDRWLILADDLTGAADSAIPFARRGAITEIVFDNTSASGRDHIAILSHDADSRRLNDAAASDNQCAAVRRFLTPRRRLFKKIDSTLRGQPAAEIAAICDTMTQLSRPAFAVFAAAFPAMGRTTRDGHVFVGEEPLERHEIWQRDHSYPSAELGAVLATAGLHVVKLPLAEIRGGVDFLQARFAAIGRAGADAGVAIVAICDALTDNDLAHIAAAAAAADPAPFFIGTAGLATALAHRIESVSRARVPLAVAKEGALIVAGSRSSATHAAAGELAAVPGVCEFKIPVQFLSRPELSEQRQALGYEITEAIEAGEDVLVSIEPGNDADAAQGSRLVRALAECLLGGMWTMSALVATGGETARALLDALGIDGIHLLDEIEAGISLGLTSGTREFPIVTKAGGFGDAHCLARCLTRLRLIRQTGTLT